MFIGTTFSMHWHRRVNSMCMVVFLKNEAAGQAKMIYEQMPESSELARQSIFFAQRYGVDPKTIRDIWYLNLTC